MAPSEPTVKTLYAHSGNICAYQSPDDGRGCETRLTDPSWDGVIGEVAHIRGQLPRSPRYDPTLTAAEVDDFDNLILLCRNCHRRVDYLERDKHTPAALHAMKEQHLSRYGQAKPFTEAEALQYARFTRRDQYGITTEPVTHTGSVDISGLGSLDVSGEVIRVTDDDGGKVVDGRPESAPITVPIEPAEFKFTGSELSVERGLSGGITDHAGGHDAITRDAPSLPRTPPFVPSARDRLLGEETAAVGEPEKMRNIDEERSALLQEDGSALLKEDGKRILMEDGND